MYKGTLSRPEEEAIAVAVKTLKVSSLIPDRMGLPLL